MKRSTVAATSVVALVALIVFAGISSAHLTSAQSGQGNTQDITRTRHDTTDNTAIGCGCGHPPGYGCHHNHLRHCSTTSEI